MFAYAPSLLYWCLYESWYLSHFVKGAASEVGVRWSLATGRHSVKMGDEIEYLLLSRKDAMKKGHDVVEQVKYT